MGAPDHISVRAIDLLPSLLSEDVLDALCAMAGTCPPGSFVEVGTFQGGSAQRIARVAEEQGRKMYVYDTFTGIPYATPMDSHRVGDFSDTCAAHIRRNIPTAHVIEGIFPQSAVEMGEIAFVHLDCDQFQSYVDSLEYLVPRMVSGGIIWSDDADCLQSAGEAFYGFTKKHGYEVKRAPKPYFVT